MLEHMPRRSRSLLCLSLTSLALTLSVLAFCTSYWCEGTQKVVKPLCLSPVKMVKCSQNNSQPFTVGTVQPELPSNETISPNQREALTKTQQAKLANAVQYIWETGEDKYMFRYFHAGFWESCEKHTDGLIGMVAHMMYTTVFQLTVIIGPKDWRPQNWDYGWSFAMAWVSFSCCMGAAVLTFNSYTKNIIEIRRRQRLRPEEARAAPSYEEVVSGVGIYSISGLQQCPDGMMDSMWLKPETVGVKAEVDIPMLVLMEGCEPEECEDCEREMDEMEKAMEREETDSPC
ncbi:germ cell-specific gene 1-like protein isoform X3 [Ictalurus punctatus]|uniref:Germ cell-specific gene 1-like protein isoform X3 n=1 Tax=Ictalurus punctatus TaxID=7998 RepID=A0A2D0R6T8_ICTPU|nr:germ cell-specific gene 1-like protein isoform X3 [Ictalurus punctatus]